MDMAEHITDTDIDRQTDRHTYICKLEPNREQNGSNLGKVSVKVYIDTLPI